MFWAIAVLVLAGFYFLLNFKPVGIKNVADVLPLSDKYKSVAYFMDYLTKTDDQEKTFLILFQNNLEIRPGGGFIGSFGILKIKNGAVESLQIHDSGIFDGRVPKTVAAPYPMGETLNIKSMQLRDSNWSPDFPTNATAAENFYYLGQGQEKFDGVVAVNANVLTSFLKATGPISVAGYPGTYGDADAVYNLEYQVEKAYVDQNIPFALRKSILNDLAQAILRKVTTLDMAGKIKLAEIIYDNLNKKDIQLSFKEAALEQQSEKAGWAGEADQKWKQDYLMAVDANLGAFKSDYYVKRSLDYTVDLTGETPEAVLRITYNHTAKQKDFMTKDYLSYLRVYAPAGSWLVSSKNFDGPRYATELGKQVFGAIVTVPIGTSKTVELDYTLPKDVAQNYNLMMQKQSGINDEPAAVHVINSNSETKDYNLVLNSDTILNK